MQESEEHTSDFDEHRSGDARTISKLQYDIEQLRAKWLGLETEIAAREELAARLNTDIDDLRESLARKENCLRPATARSRRSKRKFAVATHTIALSRRSLRMK